MDETRSKTWQRLNEELARLQAITHEDVEPGGQTKFLLVYEPPVIDEKPRLEVIAGTAKQQTVPRGQLRGV